ncbi:MAG: NADH-quinone oxidoreductase subunit B family protein [Nitrospiraceae bacterium]|nr:NADH-quinone oxidoreductase subunit B family protein [Nitrospiraceae bacterium]
MIKEILKNLLTKKSAIPFPEDFKGNNEMLEIISSKKKIETGFKRSIKIRQVDSGSCNACEWECTALSNPIYDIQRFGIDFTASPRHADILLVTGPVSRQMELALRKTYLAMPEPKLVVACGDCAIDGGIYKGSYAVTNGAANVIPVDCCIKGCPPSPSDIIQALKKLLDALADNKAQIK